jgi:hypothetical protein
MAKKRSVLFADILNPRDIFFGDDEEMYPSLGRFTPKHEALFVFVFDLGRFVVIDDSSEDGRIVNGTHH